MIPYLYPIFRDSASIPHFNATSLLMRKICIELTQKEIDACIQGADFHTRTGNVVSLVAERLCVLADKDPQPDVVVCAMPRDVEDACGPTARDSMLTKVILTPALKRNADCVERQRKRVSYCLIYLTTIRTSRVQPRSMHFAIFTMPSKHTP